MHCWYFKLVIYIVYYNCVWFVNTLFTFCMWGQLDWELWRRIRDDNSVFSSPSKFCKKVDFDLDVPAFACNHYCTMLGFNKQQFSSMLSVHVYGKNVVNPYWTGQHQVSWFNMWWNTILKLYFGSSV